MSPDTFAQILSLTGDPGVLLTLGYLVFEVVRLRRSVESVVSRQEMLEDKVTQIEVDIHG